MKNSLQISINGKRGSALIVTLILLMILTMMAVVEVSSHTAETRIVANTANNFIALQTAVGALNDAATQLKNATPTKDKFSMNANGYYLLNPNNPPIWTTVNWQSTSDVISGYQGQSIAPAAYVIEMLPSVVMPGGSMKSPTEIYRITVRAVGGTSNTVVMLQCIVQVPSL